MPSKITIFFVEKGYILVEVNLGRRIRVENKLNKTLARFRPSHAIKITFFFFVEKWFIFVEEKPRRRILVENKLNKKNSIYNSLFKVQ